MSLIYASLSVRRPSRAASLCLLFCFRYLGNVWVSEIPKLQGVRFALPSRPRIGGPSTKNAIFLPLPPSPKKSKIGRRRLSLLSHLCLKFLARKKQFGSGNKNSFQQLPLWKEGGLLVHETLRGVLGPVFEEMLRQEVEEGWGKVGPRRWLWKVVVAVAAVADVAAVVVVATAFLKNS